MTAVEIRVTDPADFGRVAAETFREALTTGSVVGLATGATPIPLYAELAARPIPAVRAFAIDEYVTSRDHPCANRAFFARHWLPIAGAAEVEQFDPEASDLQREAGRVASVLAAAGGLDVALLGIGLNGHLAFNEPGSTADSPARVVELTPASRSAASACFGDAAPSAGITLGLAELLAARMVILIATGKAKAPIVAAALEGATGPGCPASFLQEHPRVVAVLDSEAAAQLSLR